jgi:hypothetical protein
MASLQYSALDSSQKQIRLLQLESRNTSMTKTLGISCTLNQISRLINPVYMALSYTWGDQSRTRPILVDDTKAPITENLEAALHHLQQEYEALTLWVDALCINQTDEIEKSDQVKQMLEIYRGAAVTIVWLGSAADDSDRAMDSLDRIGEWLDGLGAIEVLQDLRRRTPRNDGTHYLSVERSLQKEARKIAIGHDDIPYPFEALNKMTYRPWWRRVWVTQELSVSPTVEFACGWKRVNGPRFCAGILFHNFLQKEISRSAGLNLALQMRLGSIPSLSNSVASTMLGARARFQSNASCGDETLLQLLERAYVCSYGSPLETSQPKDRILGLLGLANDSEKLGINVDYSKSCETVYIETARALLLQGHMDVLCLCQSPKLRFELPSWVPDWRAPIRTPCGGYAEDRTFCASGKSAAFVDFNSEKDRFEHIYIKGSQVDVIECIGSEWEPGFDPDKEFDWKAASTFLSEIEDLCKRSSDVHGEVSGKAFLWEDAVWRIPIADQEIAYGGSHCRATNLSHQGYKVVKKAINSPQSFRGEPDLGTKSYMCIMTSLHSKSHFLSTKGYVGLGPAHLRKGDVICILHGAHVPFILRKSEGESYQLVGEAFVYGIMDGEFVETTPEVKIFEIGSTPMR